MSKNLVVIGGGAAGFFCAVNAARLHPGLEVVLLEKTNKLLSKVRVSGGGRCNVTHACYDIAEMSKQYPRGKHFVKKSFHQFFTTDTIKWFEERGVILKTEKDGRMFPLSDSSETIISCLLKEANNFRIDIRMNAAVEKIIFDKGRFFLYIIERPLLVADFVCVACGGYSKSSMFGWLEELGHSITEPLPSLFTFNLPAGETRARRHPITELMGISVEHAKVKIAGTSLADQGALLITHWGLSGPVILRLSAWGAKELAEKNYDFTIHINWLHKLNYNDPSLRNALANFREHYSSQKIASYNFGELPQRLWLFLLTISGVSRDMRFSDLPKKTENSLVKNLVDYTVHVKGKTTFKEEFVTAGGIQLNEVDVNTMMSKKIPGLYFAGEILDVDGITGGYNFQHAWTSGYIAAKAISNAV